ncbi:MAG TPA: hypothetical protein VEA69_15170 [Tepidisphaeraceae bacterium]|nr:hypothetical protein [Tepidisphaeraceae bacterium]
MSELYEGIVFRSPEAVAREAFSGLRSPHRLRLVRLHGAETFGVYRVAGRSDAFDEEGVLGLAADVSQLAGGPSVAAFYDNSSGVRSATVFRSGALAGKFAEADERWVPTGADGYPLPGVESVPAGDRDPEAEYECARDAIELALAAAGIAAEVTGEVLKDAFVYDRAVVVAEARPT